MKQPFAALADGPVAIAYVGNSVMAQRDGFRPQLHKLLCQRTGHAHRAVNAGFGGVGALASLCTLDAMAMRHAPRLCFIECLTGDIGVGLHRHTGAALEAMLARLDAAGIVPCLLLLPRADARADAGALIALYRRVAAHHRVPTVDLVGRWPDIGKLLRDQVHSNQAGSLAYAEAIADALPMLPPWNGPSERLFADLRSAGLTEIAPDMCLGDTSIGLFRLQMAYHAIGAGGELACSLDRALLGLLVIVGPHSGVIEINRVQYDLRDRWSHYERLHALVLDDEIPASVALTIQPLTGELRLVGLLTRSTTG